MYECIETLLVEKMALNRKLTTSPEWILKLSMPDGDLLRVHRTVEERHHSPPCLHDHTYSLPTLDDEDENGISMQSVRSNVEVSTVFKVESDEPFEDEDEGVCVDDAVIEVRDYSVLEEHSYSIARLFCADEDIWKDPPPVTEDERGEEVLEDVFVDVEGKFLGSSVLQS